MDDRSDAFVHKLHDHVAQAKRDRDFWMKRTVQERLDAVEELRLARWPELADPNARMARVMTILGRHR